MSSEKESDKNAVLKFLNCYNDNENLRGFLLRKFDGSSELYWKDSETDYIVYFPFSDYKDSKNFWANNFDKYSYLYIFATLNKWRTKWMENKKIGERCSIFLHTFYTKIVQELNSFSPQEYTISSSEILELGSYIDEYLWIKERKAPIFVKYASERSLLNVRFYSRYGEILYKTYSKGVSINDIHQLFDYFSATDFVIGQSLCLCSFLSVFSPESIKNVKKVEELGCKYIPSVIKWTPTHKYICLLLLLDYFESKSTKSIDIELSTKSYIEEMKSELDLEKDRLCDKSAKEYESILSKFANKCDSNDTINSKNTNNKDEIGIVALLLAYPCYFTSSSRVLIKINGKGNLPLTKNVETSWELGKFHLGQTICFKLDIWKETYNCNKIITSISRQYTVKRSFWERLISMSGKPTLEVTIKMDVNILNNGDCTVNNIQWNFEKLWPETDDYNFGEGIGIDSTSSIH